MKLRVWIPTTSQCQHLVWTRRWSNPTNPHLWSGASKASASSLWAGAPARRFRKVTTELTNSLRLFLGGGWRSRLASGRFQQGRDPQNLFSGTRLEDFGSSTNSRWFGVPVVTLPEWNSPAPFCCVSGPKGGFKAVGDVALTADAGTAVDSLGVRTTCHIFRHLWNSLCVFGTLTSDTGARLDLEPQTNQCGTSTHSVTNIHCRGMDAA